MTIDLTAGWTNQLLFQLLSDGSAYSLSGLTVTLLLTDKNGRTVDTSSDVVVTDAAAGKVGYTPDPADILVSGSPYTMRWQVTNGSAIVFFPNGAADTMRVFPA